MPYQDEMISFLYAFTRTKKPIHTNSDLNIDLGIYGDDLWEFIEAYSKKFNVDISNFLWYFHSAEEGLGNIGGLVFKPPNKRVEYIPITPKLLSKFADTGFWDLKYPEHSIPSKRLDLILNFIVASLLILLMIVFLVWKYFFL